MTDDKITKLPIRTKAPPSGEAPVLEITRAYTRDECNHKFHFVNGALVDATYLIREGETEVECGICHTKLDPMWVLRQLAHEEGAWRRRHENYQDEMRRLCERQRTKCEHCGKMTRISGR